MSSSPDAPVEIVPYDPTWPARFEAERARLADVLAPWLDGGIHHFGSTAVPGLAAKPVIDILAGVRNLMEAGAAIGPLRGLSYQHARYHEWSLWFCKPHRVHRTHHLHLAESSHPEWRARLAFRNLLRAEPGIAAAYQQLEQRLAERYCHHREAYTQAKTAFVRDALAW